MNVAVKVHQALGPGLLESVYEVALARELERRGLAVVRQQAVPVEYEGMKFDEGFEARLSSEFWCRLNERWNQAYGERAY